MSSNNVLWSPQPKQALFMSRPEDEVLYGGAAGGGKSDALIIEALRQVHIPHYKGLILRKTVPQLAELVDKSYLYYPQAFKGARYNDTKHTWTFPSGAKIRFGSMQHAKDKYQYQGQAFDYIAFDELTHFTFEEYDYLKSRNRANGAGTRCYIRASANPGGVGHSWVKSRFITPAPPLKTVWEKVSVDMPDGKREVRWSSRTFVPSTVFDNPALMKNDPNYITRLASLAQAEKEALLYGNWDSFTGQFFSEWRNDPEHYHDRKWTHVIAPFEIPKHWKIYRSYDYGFARPFSCGWWAHSTDGVLYRIAELYGCTNTPNEGVRWNTEQQFDEIARIEREHPLLKGKRILGVADPSIWDASRGISTAETASKKGIYFTPGDNSRLTGWAQMHNRLQFSEDGYPRMQFFSTCKAAIRTIPSMVHSTTNVEDMDTDGEDHICDDCRYMAMEHIVTPYIKQIKHTEIGDDPLDLFKRRLY